MRVSRPKEVCDHKVSVSRPTQSFGRKAAETLRSRVCLWNHAFIFFRIQTRMHHILGLLNSMAMVESLRDEYQSVRDMLVR